MLYRLELDGSCTTVLSGTVSNGIGWNPDGTTMYLSDSGTGRIDAFDFDGAGGDLSGRRTIARITESGVAPDRLTVDESADIWVALWGAGALRRYSPERSLLATVPIAVDRPTSCAFGGAGLATLFITTDRRGLDATALAEHPHAGRIFCVDGLGVSGPTCAPYRGQPAPGRRLP